MPPSFLYIKHNTNCFSKANEFGFAKMVVGVVVKHFTVSTYNVVDVIWIPPNMVYIQL